MKCLIWERADGGISVEHPAFGDKIRPSTDDELIAMCQRKTQIRLTLQYGGPAICHEVDKELLPDGYFFNAYQWDGAAVVVDMTKARAIHMDKIRRVRNEELVKEDIMFMRAVEAGDTSAQSAVATKKQTLWDIPATFDITTGVTTPELLKGRWPTELPARE